MLDLAVIIVNYRTAALTVDAVHSLLDGAGLPDQSQVVVADAVSNDGSSQAIAAAIRQNGWAPTVSLIDLERNGGFAYGNNRGIEVVEQRWGGAKAYLLLNPDTLVRPAAVCALLNFLEARDKVGIVGSRLEDIDGTLQACSFRFPNAMSELESEARTGPISKLLRRWRVVLPVDAAPSRADWVSGASMMLRREVLEAVGELDERYFLYFEELDFCRRAADMGWECWTVPDSRVAHLCGQSTGVTGQGVGSKRRPAYWFHSRNHYFRQHHSGLEKLAIDGAWLLGQALWQLRRKIEGKQNIDPPHLVADFLANLRSPPKS